MTLRSGRACVAALVAAGLLASRLPAQGGAAAPEAASAADRKCRAVLVARGVGPEQQTASPCHDLAVAINDAIVTKAYQQPRDVQSSAAGSAAPAGTAAQAGAAPSTQPTALAAATMASVANDSGSAALTSVSINPAMLFSATDDPAEIARLSRLADVTVFFPVDGLDQNKDGRLDYGGIRVRLNLSAGAQAATLQEVARQATKQLVGELRIVNALRDLLTKASDPGKCAVALTTAAATPTTITEACGASISLRIDDEGYALLRKAAAKARAEADARYFGVDLRFDTGDPTLGKVRNAAGTALVAGLAFGRRFDPASLGASSGIRGRIGVRHVALRDTSVVDWQMDGGLAWEAVRVSGEQRLEMNLGLEFRASGNRTAERVLQTRYVELRGGIIVPIAGATNIAVSFSTPMIGDTSPTLAVSANWQQLLGALRGER